MQFEIKNINKSISNLMRTIGYQPAYFQKEGEVSIVRQLSRDDYPRFHLYIKERKSLDTAVSRDKLNTYVFNLHLDQKKLSYKGNHAHSGEYEGNIIEVETERIKSLL